MKKYEFSINNKAGLSDLELTIIGELMDFKGKLNDNERDYEIGRYNHSQRHSINAELFMDYAKRLIDIIK